MYTMTDNHPTGVTVSFQGGCVRVGLQYDYADDIAGQLLKLLERDWTSDILDDPDHERGFYVASQLLADQNGSMKLERDGDTLHINMDIPCAEE